MKSAYERAMDRFGGETSPQKLSEEQKKRIAEINSIYEAKIAERQTFLTSKIAAARSTGDFTEIEALESQLARDISVIREEWETKKDKVWKTSDHS
ncbi:MAG: hypothetical protein ACFCUX_00915 [Candidatus Methylacidiphilales bacterium]